MFSYLGETSIFGFPSLLTECKVKNGKVLGKFGSSNPILIEEFPNIKF